MRSFSVANAQGRSELDCSRLAIAPPDFDDHRFLALQASIMSERAKTLREAVAVLINVVKELVLVVVDARRPEPVRVFVRWILCMIFASLRFDDGIHVKPKELVMRDEGLFGVAWQTKVERKKVGARFAVPSIGFIASQWLAVGWELFQREHMVDRDFWVPELKAQKLISLHLAVNFQQSAVYVLDKMLSYQSYKTQT